MPLQYTGAGILLYSLVLSLWYQQVTPWIAGVQNVDYTPLWATVIAAFNSTFRADAFKGESTALSSSPGD